MSVKQPTALDLRTCNWKVNSLYGGERNENSFQSCSSLDMNV